MAVDRPHDVELAVVRDPRRAGRVLGRSGDELVGLLLGDRMHAVLTRTVVAQPDMVEPGDGTVGPRHRDPAVGVDGVADRRPFRIDVEVRRRGHGSTTSSGSAASIWGVSATTAGVLLLRPRQHRLRRTDLDDVAVGHHGDPVGDGPHERQVVRDEQHRKAEVTLQLGQQFDDRGLDEHVEGRCDLVADEHVRSAHQRPRDGDPAAARLRRAGRGTDRRRPTGATPAPASRRPPGGTRRPTPWRSPAAWRWTRRSASRVERAVQVLEHILDLQPLGDGSMARRTGEGLAVEQDLPGPFVVQPADRAGHRGLAEPDSPTRARHSPWATCRSTL